MRYKKNCLHTKKKSNRKTYQQMSRIPHGTRGSSGGKSAQSLPSQLQSLQLEQSPSTVVTRDLSHSISNDTAPVNAQIPLDGQHSQQSYGFVPVSKASQSQRLKPQNELDGSPSIAARLTIHLLDTYHRCNPNYAYKPLNNPRRVLTKPSKPTNNDGHDNEDWDYILYVNDVLGAQEGQQYQILDILGQGTFGQVVKCVNLKTKETVAVKVIKNKPAYYNQSLVEVAILEMLNKQYDRSDKHHIARMKDTFVFRNHLCIIFEMLSVNLYELIKQNQFRGLSTNLVRVFVSQILDCLVVLSRARIIHCDLKPENILLKNLETPAIKVIDFGSACHENQTVYTYIQSRFYRSPEVLLGLPYTSSIDMWSLGCIAAELFLGLPLFPGSSEYNQISRIVEVLGVPPSHMCERGKSASQFFDKRVVQDSKSVFTLKPMDKYVQEQNAKEQPSKRYLNGSSLPEIINLYPIMRKGLSQKDIDKEMYNRQSFVDFLQGVLNMNPLERWSPQQARQHPFITGETFTGRYLPSNIPARMTQPQPIPQTVSADATPDAGDEGKAVRPRAATISSSNVQPVPLQLQRLAVIHQNGLTSDSHNINPLTINIPKSNLKTPTFSNMADKPVEGERRPSFGNSGHSSRNTTTIKHSQVMADAERRYHGHQEYADNIASHQRDYSSGSATHSQPMNIAQKSRQGSRRMSGNSLFSTHISQMGSYPEEGMPSDGYTAVPNALSVGNRAIPQPHFPMRKAQSDFASEQQTMSGHLPTQMMGAYSSATAATFTDGHPRLGRTGERSNLPSRIPSAASHDWEPFLDSNFGIGSSQTFSRDSSTTELPTVTSDHRASLSDMSPGNSNSVMNQRGYTRMSTGKPPSQYEASFNNANLSNNSPDNRNLYFQQPQQQQQQKLKLHTKNPMAYQQADMMHMTTMTSPQMMALNPSDFVGSPTLRAAQYSNQMSSMRGTRGEGIDHQSANLAYQSPLSASDQQRAFAIISNARRQSFSVNLDQERQEQYALAQASSFGSSFIPPLGSARSMDTPYYQPAQIHSAHTVATPNSASSEPLKLNSEDVDLNNRRRNEPNDKQ